MTRGSITTIIIYVVLICRIHVDIAVPMLPNGIRCVVEEEIIRGRQETVASRGFVHAVTDETFDMLTDVGDPAMGHRNGHIEIVRTVRWITVTELAVEGKYSN